MRIGFALPQMGPIATPKTVTQVAQKAEALGYDSLWVLDRLLYPVKPQTPYVGTPDGSLPDVYKRVLDPVETLTFAAAHTTRIALGTSVLDIPFYHPVVLARQLTTLDVLSGGRLRVGFGLGWSKDEFDAVGASARERGRRADEFIKVLKAIWTTDPVEFHGTYYHVPRSVIGLKPVQKPHPPIYLAAYAPAALKRAATLANGWLPVGVPVEGMAQMMTHLREMAKAAGRDPSTLELVVRANLHVTAQPLGADRWIFSGSLDQIKADVDRVRALGANEVFFDPTFSPDAQTAEAYLASMERIRRLV
ncbi:MAG: LLM class F420-dependent oxidoreductase [Candidatus Rokubacteria bacterium]|nr:LLM class F420-dependent oxidoreductase [Candidatus Rokubacteria bacterium]